MTGDDCIEGVLVSCDNERGDELDEDGGIATDIESWFLGRDAPSPYV